MKFSEACNKVKGEKTVEALLLEGNKTVEALLSDKTVSTEEVKLELTEVIHPSNKSSECLEVNYLCIYFCFFLIRK